MLLVIRRANGSIYRRYKRRAECASLNEYWMNTRNETDVEWDGETWVARIWIFHWICNETRWNEWNGCPKGKNIYRRKTQAAVFDFKGYCHILHIRITQGKGRNSIYKEISSRIFFSFCYIRLKGRQTHKWDNLFLPSGVWQSDRHNNKRKRYCLYREDVVGIRTD